MYFMLQDRRELDEYCQDVLTRANEGIEILKDIRDGNIRMDEEMMKDPGVLVTLPNLLVQMNKVEKFNFGSARSCKSFSAKCLYWKFSWRLISLAVRESPYRQYIIPAIVVVCVVLLCNIWM